VEERPLAKENTQEPNSCRTPSRESEPNGLARVREAAKKRALRRQTSQHPRQEPCALAAPARVCAGGGPKGPSLPRPSRLSRRRLRPTSETAQVAGRRQSSRDSTRCTFEPGVTFVPSKRAVTEFPGLSWPAWP
jgi:hypothetical protein